MILTYEQIEKSRLAISIIANETLPKESEDSKHIAYCISKNLEQINKIYDELAQEKQTILEDHAEASKPDKDGRVSYTVPKAKRQGYRDAMKKFNSTEVDIRIRKVDYDKYPLPIPAAQLSDAEFMFSFPGDWEKEE